MQGNITLVEDIKQASSGMQLINPFLHLDIHSYQQVINFKLAILTSGLDLSQGLRLSLNIENDENEDVVYDVPEQNVPINENQASDNFQITANVIDVQFKEAGTYTIHVLCNGEKIEQKFTVSLEESG